MQSDQNNVWPLFVLGPDKLYVLLSYALLSTPIILTNEIIANDIDMHIMLEISTAVLLAIFTYLVFSDPGLMPKCANTQSVGWTYCSLCASFRPPTCVHCVACGTCIHGYDHHCPWTGKCIGSRNKRKFKAFSLALTLVLVLVVIILLCHFFLPVSGPI